MQPSSVQLFLGICPHPHNLIHLQVAVSILSTPRGSYRWGAGGPCPHLRLYTFRIFNSIIAQCISITIPASPNLVPRLPEPTVGILPPPNIQHVTSPLVYSSLLCSLCSPVLFLKNFGYPNQCWEILGAHGI